MDCAAGGERDLISRAHDLVHKLYAEGRYQRAIGPYLEVVVVSRRLPVRALNLDDRQRVPVCLHLTITPAGSAQQVRAANLEPHEVVRVVDDTHLSGLGVAHAHAAGGSTDAQRAAGEERAPIAAAFSSRVARSGSGVWNTAEPTTMIRAPAPTTRATFWWSMPPSISTGAVLPARSRAARTSRTLDSLRGMKACPPKPGLTDITRTKSTSPATSSMSTTGVDGLST